jgi:hypothetical protein
MFGRSWGGFYPYGSGVGFGRPYLAAGIGYPYYGGFGGFGCGYPGWCGCYPYY